MVRLQMGLMTGALLMGSPGTEAEPPPPPSESHPPRAASVLARALTAVNSSGALTTLRSLRMRGSLQSGGLTGEIHASFSLEGRAMERTRLGSLHSETVLLPDGGWTRERGGAVLPLTPAQAQARRDSLYYDTFRYLTPRGSLPMAEDLGIHEDENAAPCRWLRLTPSGLTPRDLCFSTLTGLPLRARFRDPEDGGLRTVSYDDYRTVGGLTLPFRLSIQTKGMEPNRLTLRVASWEVDPPLIDEDFARPSKGTQPVYDATRAARAIPLRFDGSHYFVNGFLAGKGPYTFLLDTGSTTSLLDRGLARQLGLVPEGDLHAHSLGGPATVQVVRMPPLELPGLRLPEDSWATLPLTSSFLSSDGIEVHGVLGADLLHRVVLDLDPVALTMALHDPETYEYRGDGIPLPLLRIGRFLAMEVSLEDGHPHPFAIDFGADVMAVGAQTPLGQSLKSSYGEGVQVVGSGLGGAVPLRALRVASIRAGPFRLASPWVHLLETPLPALQEPGIVGVLGTSFLRRFRMVLDLSRETVWLSPQSAYGEPDRLDASGLSLGWEAGGWRVHKVLPGSPASLAGLKVGMAILAVQGRTASSLGRATWMQLLAGSAGTTLELTVSEEGKVRRTRIELEGVVKEGGSPSHHLPSEPP